MDKGMYKLDFLFLVENANLRGGTEIQTINITHALIEANYRAKLGMEMKQDFLV